MKKTKDATLIIREKAASFENVITGTSCIQSSFKTNQGAFLFIGPGVKGIGYKAMFKLRESMDQAQKLADELPKRFEVGSMGWVTTRFTDEEPLSESLWEAWLQESYFITERK